ncbi:MAG TPA: hypothetical protein VGK19_22400 [Capsulimonadaceae bacterium]|jgi:hypothetical protein
MTQDEASEAQRLVGQLVTRVALKPDAVALLFFEDHLRYTNTLYSSGRWHLKDNEGTTLDRDSKSAARTSFNLWKLVGSTVSGAHIVLGDRLLIQFDSGLKLSFEGAVFTSQDWKIDFEDGNSIVPAPSSG